MRLALQGFLCFSDPAKAAVGGSLQRLARLGVQVKIVTGDNGQVGSTPVPASWASNQAAS